MPSEGIAVQLFFEQGQHTIAFCLAGEVVSASFVAVKLVLIAALIIAFGQSGHDRRQDCNQGGVVLPRSASLSNMS